MADPLKSSYNWRVPVALSTVALVVGVAILARGQVAGWISTAVVLVLCYAGYLGVVWRRTQAYLIVDGPVLTVRTSRAFHRIEGSRVVKVAQTLTRNGPSYRLSVRGEDGRLTRYAAPTALLHRGHATLFDWILTWAPQAELDKGSRRTLQTLRERGAVPYADQTDLRTTESPTAETHKPIRRPIHPPFPTQSEPTVTEQPGNDQAGDDQSGAGRVSRVLADAASPSMPADVAARLDAVLAAESARRQARDTQNGAAQNEAAQDRVGGTRVIPFGPVDRGTKPELVTTSDAGRQWRRSAGIALVAAVSAAAVGLAGYTVAASAGLDEPSAATPLQVQSADLAEQASAIAAARNLSAHTFSGAWRCARTVTPGRITALTPALVDGTPALLVYTSVRGENWVTVVTGCPRPGALARESVRLPP